MPRRFYPINLVAILLWAPVRVVPRGTPTGTPVRSRDTSRAWLQDRKVVGVPLTFPDISLPSHRSATNRLRRGGWRRTSPSCRSCCASRRRQARRDRVAATDAAMSAARERQEERGLAQLMAFLKVARMWSAWFLSSGGRLLKPVIMLKNEVRPMVICFSYSNLRSWFTVSFFAEAGCAT